MNNRICIKIGSNVLTGQDGLPNESLIQNIVQQIASLMKSGRQVILVSSGAVAAGRSVFKSDKKLDTVAERQLLSSLGQVKLINIYTEMFSGFNQHCAQVLVTKQDFKDRNHYLNMQNCLNAILSNSIIPIVNENDVISITELMFTDNDELAGLISAMLNVDRLSVAHRYCSCSFRKRRYCHEMPHGPASCCHWYSCRDCQWKYTGYHQQARGRGKNWDLI